MDRSELALKNYRKAVELQPGYTTAWNNLGDAYEKAKDWDQVMSAHRALTHRRCQSRFGSMCQLLLVNMGGGLHEYVSYLHTDVFWALREDLPMPFLPGDRSY